ncbi:hypothetical protein HPP92_015492 [Vanilla planifolia]|uniref:Protein ECERIFERUM 7 n=1 Tax=Vanilla planifolia TaxID=51239 RepID=A0A835QD48_VANPL|nr:hypothetical protein HPP92_015492 [Vanilla planifolia]
MPLLGLREYGSSEVQLGETLVLGYVSAQLVQPYRDRPNEGTLSIFTEFSPMADPSFEAGRPGESAIELGRVIDRGLRAIDMESLCVVAGKSVWSIRVDLHILDNGGNLIDAANIAALTALLTFRRPECSLGGDNGQDVVIHNPKVREPLPLTMHHIPVAVTFAFFNEGDVVVIDPTFKEEAIMGGRMTATLNSNGDVCAVQKAGGHGVSSSVIMHCLRLASLKASDMTGKITSAVDSYNAERAFSKVKRHTSFLAANVGVPDNVTEGLQINLLAEHQIETFQDQSENISKDDTSLHRKETSFIKKDGNAFLGGPSNWDPYSQGISTISCRNPQVSSGLLKVARNLEEKTITAIASIPELVGSSTSQLWNSPKSLKDAVKQKNRNKNPH